MCSISITLICIYYILYIFMYMYMDLVQTFNLKFADHLSDCNFSE